MASASSPPTVVTVALPVYGTRVLPRFGIAREFLFAEIAPPPFGLRSVVRRAWDPGVNPVLPAWLRGLGAAGVICGGIHPRFRVELEAADLWVVWGRRGDAEDVVRRWAAGEAGRADLAPFTGLPESGACTGRDRT